MNRISHPNHINKTIPDELLKFIIKRFESIAQDTDVPPIIILVKPDDNITGPDYAFIGNQGLLSDLYEEFEPQQEGFIRPFEWVSYHEDLRLYELLFLVGGEDGFWIVITEEIVEMHPDLKWVLTDDSLGGLSPSQPLF